MSRHRIAHARNPPPVAASVCDQRPAEPRLAAQRARRQQDVEQHGPVAQPDRVRRRRPDAAAPPHVDRDVMVVAAGRQEDGGRHRGHDVEAEHVAVEVTRRLDVAHVQVEMPHAQPVAHVPARRIDQRVQVLDVERARAAAVGREIRPGARAGGRRRARGRCRRDRAGRSPRACRGRTCRRPASACARSGPARRPARAATGTAARRGRARRGAPPAARPAARRAPGRRRRRSRARPPRRRADGPEPERVLIEAERAVEVGDRQVGGAEAGGGREARGDRSKPS